MIKKTEIKIIEELQDLCTSDGYAHVIAYLSVMHNFNIFKENQLQPDDINESQELYPMLRIEIALLIGLMVKKDISIVLPKPEKMQSMIDDTNRLRNELHHSMMVNPFEGYDFNDKKQFKIFKQGNSLKEPIFYAPESAYDFQYHDLALNVIPRMINGLLIIKVSPQMKQQK